MRQSCCNWKWKQLLLISYSSSQIWWSWLQNRWQCRLLWPDHDNQCHPSPKPTPNHRHHPARKGSEEDCLQGTHQPMLHWSRSYLSEFSVNAWSTHNKGNSRTFTTKALHPQSGKCKASLLIHKQTFIPWQSTSRKSPWTMDYFARMESIMREQLSDSSRSTMTLKF